MDLDRGWTIEQLAARWSERSRMAWLASQVALRFLTHFYARTSRVSLKYDRSVLGGERLKKKRSCWLCVVGLNEVAWLGPHSRNLCSFWMRSWLHRRPLHLPEKYFCYASSWLHSWPLCVAPVRSRVTVGCVTCHRIELVWSSSVPWKEEILNSRTAAKRDTLLFW